MSVSNNQFKSIKIRAKKLFVKVSIHYFAYTLALTFVVFSVIHIVTATTPNPGHPWSELGDGVFAVTNNQSAPRTYTFPDANATVLTTNDTVTVAQGGTGLSSIALGSVLVANTANTLSALTSVSGTKVLTNTDGTITWGTAPSSGLTVGSTSIASGNNGRVLYNNSGTLGEMTTTGTGTVLALATSPAFTTPSLGVATATSINGLTLTSNTTGFAIAGGTTSKTLTVSNTLTLAGTDGSTLNIGTGGTLGTGAFATIANYVPYTGATTNVVLGANTLSTTSGLISPKLYPASDSTTAIQFNKADGATNVMNIDTTNGRIGINTTTPGSQLEIKGLTTEASLGSDQVTNGTFDTDLSGWTATTWTHSSARANYTGTTGAIASSSVKLNNGGTGYTNGDVLTLSNGANDATITVTGVSSGRITSFNQTSNGTANTVSSSVNSTGGTGSGATFSITRLVDSTNTLSQNVSVSNGNTYEVKYTITRSAGELGLSLGVMTGHRVNTAGTYTQVITAVSTGNLIFTPTVDFTGSVDNISVKLITPTTSSTSLVNSNGLSGIEFRSGGALLYNTFVGYQAGLNNTIGNSNSAFGYRSLFKNTTGYQNTANGYYSLYSNTTGNSNTANGYYSLYSNTTGNFNTANGYYSLYSNTTGSNNTANGYYSLYYNTTGYYNTANGYYSLQSNTTGNSNTANGYYSLYYNTTGNYNTANGNQSLQSNTTGNSNTANGYQSLYYNTTGSSNTANGSYSLYYNTTGSYNTANGNNSLYSNTTGSNNTANGNNSLYYNTTGNYNTANGYYSLQSNTTGSQNIAFGYNSGRYQADGSTALTDPENSIYIGSGTRGFDNNDSNSIVVGYNAIGKGANTAVWGNTSITNHYFSGNITLTGSAGTARLHLPAGTATAGTAPLKLTAGINLTAAEAGAMEWDGTNLFITQTTGPTRKTIAYTSDIVAQVYPGAGIPNSTGSAWGTSYTTTGSGTVVALATSPVFTTPSLGVATGTSLDLTAGNLDLDNTIETNEFGVITKNGKRFIHDYNYGNNGTVTTNGENLFIGEEAGNFSMGSTATVVTHSSYNVGIGRRSLFGNTTGYANVGLGNSTLYTNTTGIYNTAIGYFSLYSNDTGNYNFGLGVSSLRGNVSGNNNVAIGYEAGRYIANGSTANTTGDYNIFIGNDTKANADNDQNQIVIGYNTTGNGSNTVTIGNSSILRTYLRGVNLAAGTATAGTAPLKLTAGTNLSTTEAGAIEYDGTHLYFTATNGGTRYQLDQQSGGVAWDAIGDPSGNGSIAFGSTVQTMDWGTATTQNALSMTGGALTTGKLLSLSSNTLTSGTLLDITSNGTGALTNQKGLNISLSGTNGTSAQTTYGAYISNTHAGTTSTNVGLYATASGGTNNYAAIFANGRVGIGTNSPTARFDVTGSISEMGGKLINILGGVGDSGDNGSSIFIKSGEGGSSAGGNNGGLVELYAGNGGTGSLDIGGNGGDIKIAGGVLGTGFPSGRNGYIILGIPPSSSERNNVGIGIATPTARLHLMSGTATSGTAPLKLTTGTALTTPEDGAMEYHNSHLYFTIGSTRYQLDQQGGGLTVGTTAISSGNNGRVLYNNNGILGEMTTTGSGTVLALATTPTFTTNITTPLVIGGTGTTSDLSFQTTSGVGATGADMHFLVGNNGATEAMTILNSGYIGIGTNNPQRVLSVVATNPTLTLDRSGNGLNEKVRYMGVDTAGGMIFGKLTDDYSSGPQHMVLDTEGRLVIGTSAAMSGYPLNVYNSSTNPGVSGTGVYIYSPSVYGAGFTVESTDTGGHKYNIFSTGSSNSGGAGAFKIYDNTMSANRLTISSGGNFGIGSITSPTASLHLPAGTATANTAPLKFTAGTNLTTAEAGAMEWDGTNLFITQTSGSTRKTLAYTSDLAIDLLLPSQSGNSGKYLTTNGTSASWATVSGSGNVIKVGTPVDNQIGVWTGDGTIEGTSSFTYDGTSLYHAGAGPRYKLNATSGLAGIEFYTSSTREWLVYNAAGIFIWKTDTQNKMSLTQGGDVGIGGNITDTTTMAGSYLALKSGNAGFGGINTPTARIHLPAGTATAGTAPLKLTTGTALTTPEDGALEYHSSHLYFTIGSTRYQLDQQGGGSGNVTKVGTPADNQIGVWTGDGTIEGNNNFTWNGTTLNVAGTVSLNSTRIMYLPNQATLTGSLVYGTGGGSLTHTTGEDGQNNSIFGIDAGTSLTTGANNTLFGYQAGGDLDVTLGNTAFGYMAMPLLSGSGNDYNGAFGYKSLYSLTSGGQNVGLGDHDLTNLVTGSNNTAVGSYTLWGGTTYSNNTAVGHYAFYNSANSAIGDYNTAIGESSARSATGSSGTYVGYLSGAKDTGTGNVFLGAQAGSSVVNTSTAISANYTTGVGYKALYSLSSGTNNNAFGFNSLGNVTTGGTNLALGSEALWTLQTGGSNVAVGHRSLYSATGSYNTALGAFSLNQITSGTNNVAIGYDAGRFITGGATPNTTSGNSIYIGYGTKASADGNTNEIVIGHGATGNGSNTVTIGNTSTLRTYLKGVNLAAGTATAGTAPLKFTTGTALTTPEDGAMEYHNSHLYFTIGSTRYQLDQQSAGAGLTVGGSAITGGSSGRVLYNNAGVLGEMTTTGSGTVLALATTPTFTTNITTPLVLGGTGTTQDLTFQTTSGVGTTGADMHFLVGNNGATEAITILNNGNVGIKETNPIYALEVNGQISAVSSSFPVNKILRTTTTTSGSFADTTGVTSGYLLKTMTSGTMGDAFGGGLVFSVRGGNSEGTDSEGIVGRIYARRDGADTSGAMQFFGGSNGNSVLMSLRASGNVGIGEVTSPTARLHLPAGTATAGTAPLKFTTGTALTTPEDGALEYHNSHLYFTIGSTRYQLDQQSGGSSQWTTTGSDIYYNTGRVFIGSTSESTSGAKLALTGTTSANGSTAGVIGALGNYTFNPTAGGIQVGNRFVVTNSPTTTANTAVGEIIRMVDNTTLANLMRGLDITANAGSNTAGTNTGLRASGATFGVQGITTGLAGGVSVPAALYGESTGTTQGDVLRLYSNTMTSASSFATFYHDTSTFTGTGLLMDFATGSGSFTGNFADFQKNNTSLFKVTNAGIVSMGLSSTSSTTAVCSSLATSTSPTAGVAYEIRDCSSSPVADYAEMYPVEEDVSYGDIVMVGEEMVNTYDTTNGEIDWNKIKSKIPKLKKSNSSYDNKVIGIVSENYGDFSSVGYNIKEEDNPMPIALNGRVPVKISIDSNPISVGDYITVSLDEGKGMKAIKAGFVIGKALESWDKESGVEMIMIYVEQGYYNGDSIERFAVESLGLSIDTSDEIMDIYSSSFSELILEKLVTEFDLMKDKKLSEILLDRLVASFEIITPRLVTNNIISKGESLFAGVVNFEGEVNVLNKIKFNKDTAGFALVKEGSKSVRIEFENYYDETPIVTASISYEGEDGESEIDPELFFEENIQYIVSEKNTKGFTIILNKEAPFDVRFSWTALSVKDPNIFESIIEIFEKDSSNENQNGDTQETVGNTQSPDNLDLVGENDLGEESLIDNNETQTEDQDMLMNNIDDSTGSSTSEDLSLDNEVAEVEENIKTEENSQDESDTNNNSENI